MRELELPEIELVAGGFGFDDDTARQPTVQVVGQRTTRSVDRFDHWDTPQYGGISAGDIIALGGGGGAGPAADESSDSEESNCQQHAANIAAAEASVQHHTEIHDAFMNGLDPSYDGELSVSDAIGILSGAQGGRADGGDVAAAIALNNNIIAAEAELDEAIDASNADGC